MSHRNTRAFTTLFLSLILSPLAAQAQVEQVDLRVDGLACPFCAYGLEKKVSRLEGYVADSYTVRINEGVVSFGLRSDTPLDLDAVERAVDKAGFTLRGVKGRFLGTLEKGKDEYLLRLLAPFDRQFVLREPSTTPPGDASQGQAPLSRTLSDRLQERLESMIADGNAVEIVGRVPTGRKADALDSMEVSDLDVLGPPSESGGRVLFEVKGLRCGGCVTRVVQAVGSLEDVLHVQGRSQDDRVEIWTRSSSPDSDDLQEKLEALGFHVRRLAQGHRDSTGGSDG